MSELNLSTVRRRYYPVKTKLSAVRDRVINEIGSVSYTHLRAHET